MGEAALALQPWDHAAAIACLDRLEGADQLIDQWRCPATCSGHACRRRCRRASGERPGWRSQALLKDNYMAETLTLLPLVYRHVGMASKALNRIADTLQQWEKALLACRSWWASAWMAIRHRRLCSRRLPK
jgi:hypothetical protein